MPKRKKRWLIPAIALVVIVLIWSTVEAKLSKPEFEFLQGSRFAGYERDPYGSNKWLLHYTVDRGAGPVLDAAIRELVNKDGWQIGGYSSGPDSYFAFTKDEEFLYIQSVGTPPTDVYVHRPNDLIQRIKNFFHGL